MSNFTKQSLNLDDINWKYFDFLCQLKKSSKGKEQLKIGENVSFSLKNLPIFQYKDLQKKTATYFKNAKSCSIWLKKAQGGGGTSIKREIYLKKLTGDAHLRAKGTDLFVYLGDDLISLAEVQILQSAHSLMTGDFKEIFYDDLVGKESQGAIHKMWKRKSWLDKSTTYIDLGKKVKGFSKFKETLQALLPTLDDRGELTLDRQAPGGHAFFAFETLISAAEEKDLPPATGTHLLSVIGNGEDLGSTPDGVIFGWIVEEKIPITMITTDKTEIDLKGGQIASYKSRDGQESVTIIEQAQAKESGQLDVFEKNKGLFNTNVAVFNYSVLVPKLKKLCEKIGVDSFERIIMPTLIENKKTQKNADGEVHTYEQLEGAMGSTLLNLDAAWRRNFNEPLVHFVNIDRANRTRFFSPVKTAFDFFLLFHSDRFNLDQKTFRLVDNRPGALPFIQLNHPFYLEVQNVLGAFSNTEVLDLDYLLVEGNPVTLSDLKLAGKVHIINTAERMVDLKNLLNGKKELKNQTVRITPQEQLILS